MNIVFLIGNGFDKKLGMQTGYREFYDYYCEVDNQDQVIKDLKINIHDNIEDWADLEDKLGDYTENLDEDSAIEVIEDLKKEIKNYLLIEDSKFDPRYCDRNKFVRDLLYPEEYLMKKQIPSFKENYHNSKNHVTVSIVSFNYTSTMDKILGLNSNSLEGEEQEMPYTINPIDYIHGELSSTRIILGVDNSIQIKNNSLRSIDKIKYRYIKSLCNETYDNTEEGSFTKLISSADIICIYGMSLGETDNSRWITILNHLVNSHSVAIVFYKCQEIRELQGPLYRDFILDTKNILLSKGKYDSSIGNKIYVSSNPEMFNIKKDSISPIMTR